MGFRMLDCIQSSSDTSLAFLPLSCFCYCYDCSTMPLVQLQLVLSLQISPVKSDQVLPPRSLQQPHLTHHPVRGS